MRGSIAVAILLLSLVASACAKPAAAPVSAPSANTGAAVQAPAQADAVPAASWQRPTDVAPLPAEGKFEVISQTPWPGQKVRVFFFGVQG
jgi:hypothetical protein